MSRCFFALSFVPLYCLKVYWGWDNFIPYFAFLALKFEAVFWAHMLGAVPIIIHIEQKALETPFRNMKKIEPD